MTTDGSKFVPAIALRRTEAERQDQMLSWNRPDDAFFAAGACHILAFRFKTRRRDKAWDIAYIRPHGDRVGSHVYVTDGTWAFDFNGWTPEHVLLELSAIACRRLDPTWGYTRIIIDQTLEAFCHAYRCRLPSEYAFDPTPRADAYLDPYGDRPPDKPTP